MKASGAPQGTLVTSCTKLPTSPAHGKVIGHATTMLPAMPQRTAEKRTVAPVPSTALETVNVVETGKPR